MTFAFHPHLEPFGALNGDEPAHAGMAKTAELRAGDLVLEFGIPGPVRISAVVTLGTNQIGIVRPGTASCCTRNSGTPKLWMTSLLRSLTMIGLFTGRES